MGDPGPVESGHSRLLPLGQCVSEGSRLWRLLCQGKPEPGRQGCGAQPGSQCSRGTDHDRPLCRPACWDPGQLSSMLQPCLSLPRAGHTPNGLHMGHWETGQVAPSHPVWFGQPRKEEINAFVFVLGAARRIQPHGFMAGLLWERLQPRRGLLSGSPQWGPGELALVPCCCPLTLCCTRFLAFSKQAFAFPTSRCLCGWPLCLRCPPSTSQAQLVASPARPC